MGRPQGAARKYRRVLVLVLVLVVALVLLLSALAVPSAWHVDWEEATIEEVVLGAPLEYVAAVVGTRIAVGSREYEIALDRAATVSGHIHNTREYQIDLDKMLWRYDRRRLVVEYLTYLNEITEGEFSFSASDHKEEFYHRYSMDTSPRTFAKRRKQLILRIRDYLRGPRTGLTTVDMKFRDGNDYEDVASLPAKPAAAFIPDRSVQKIEQDVHACDVRWSRASRVFCPGGVTIDTVDDVTELFPQVTSLSRVERGMPMAISGMNVYYWQMSHSQVLSCGLKYKSTFTLMYPTLEAAMDGTARPIKDGEWSIRLWSGLEGLAPDFVPSHQQLVDELYEKIIFSKWNSDEDMVCMYDEEGGHLPFVGR